MSEKDKTPEQPTIRFAGRDIPTYEAWKKIEAADVAANKLEQLNTRYPHLATEASRAAVTNTRKRLKSIAVHMPKAPEKAPELEEIIAGLLPSCTLDELLERLEREHGVELDFVALIHLIGFDAYCDALRKEVAQYQRNFLSFEQIAELWNESKMPAPGGRPRWDDKTVERLMKG